MDHLTAARSRTRTTARPAPQWVQGLVTGVTLTLLAVTIPVFLHDNAADGVVTTGTAALVYATVVALATCAGVYLPRTGTDQPSTAAIDRLAADY